MLFSPADLMTEHWLPEIPEMEGKLVEDENYKAISIKLHQLSTVNGLPDLKAYLSLSGEVKKLNIDDSGGTKYIDLIKCFIFA